MKKKRFLPYMTVCCLIALLFAGCSSDDDNGTDSRTTQTEKKMFILNEGGYGLNNSSISLYSPADTLQDVTDLFYAANGRYLGDTGQDMIINGTTLYVSVYGSGYIAKLDTAGNELCSAPIYSPRSLALDGGYLYVTSYTNRVYKCDAETLEKVDSVSTGMNPEQIVVYDDMLVVANSGWGYDSTLTVIDLPTFTFKKSIDVVVNPNKVAVCGGKLFVISNNDYVDLILQQIDVEAGTASRVAVASNMFSYEDKLYLSHSVTDWATHTSVNSFFVYDAVSGATEPLVLTGAPASLYSKTISMYEINPCNGELYVGTSDYVTTGDIYRFAADGTFIRQFDAGGITPNHACFYE